LLSRKRWGRSTTNVVASWGSSTISQPSLSEFARLIAGLPSDCRADRFVKFRRLKLWQNYSSCLDRNYCSFKAKFAEPVSTWARMNLTADRSFATIFYPFGGPDFAFAYLLYPNADNYVLCGLEPCAPQSLFTRPTKASIMKALKGLHTTVEHFLTYSFFTTKEMRELFHNLHVPGVALVLLTLIGRLDLRPISIDFLLLQSGAERIPGICITVECGGRTRRVFYFQQDFRDGHFLQDGALSRFLAEKGELGALIKSASYLLHEQNFSNLRQFILQSCSMVVQDPSGIPFRDFGAEVVLSLYGSYIQAPASFGKYEQPELVHAFAADSRSDLDFGFGYFHRDAGAGLMLATVPGQSIRSA
jgi:hypothetical protein